MTDELTVAAIASQFTRFQEAFDIIIEDELTGDGWQGTMNFIVGCSQIFSSHMPEAWQYDWYLSVDTFTESLAKHITTNKELPSDFDVHQLAKAAIEHHTH